MTTEQKVLGWNLSTGRRLVRYVRLLVKPKPQGAPAALSPAGGIKKEQN